MGLITLGVLLTGFIALATMGGFMTEEAGARYLVENAAIAGLGLLMPWIGLRLRHRRP